MVVELESKVALKAFLSMAYSPFALGALVASRCAIGLFSSWFAFGALVAHGGLLEFFVLVLGAVQELGS